MTLADKIVTAALLLAAAFIMIFSGLFLNEDNSSGVLITLNGKEYAAYRFSEIEEDITLEISSEYGSNTVVVTKEGAYVKAASCEDKLDVKMGKISRAGQMIVCLPNRLMIEIIGGGTVDKVTY